MSRKEGRRIRSGMPMDAVSPFIMPTRSGASNSFSATINIEKCEQLIRQKRAEGMLGFGMIHLFMAAYVRVISSHPGLNRFIRGQRVYARNGIEICMTIKKEMKLNAPETVVKLYLNPEDTAKSVYEQLCREVNDNRKGGDQNNMDTMARVLVSFPGVFLRGTVSFLRFLDYFGMLPRWLTKLSPFHGSMFITNMGSLGMPPIYHHLYNFGNLPLFISMGEKRSRYVITKDGTAKKERVIDFTVMCDERICDGHYYASAFKALKKALENPENLFTPPEKIEEDIA